MSRGLLGASFLALVLSAAAPAPAPAARKPKLLPGLLIELRSADGWILKAKHLPAKDDQMTFLLLHGTGQRKEEWYSLARGLAGWGYGYLALDFRGHGESTTAPNGEAFSYRKFVVNKNYNEFANMSRDVDAAMAYLAGQGVPEERVGVIGADVGSSIGLKYAAVHSKVPMIVLLSPGLSYREVLTVNAMRAYKGRPILMIHSAADKESSKATPLLYGFAKLSTGELNATMISVEHEHGTRMLRRHRDLIPKIIDWIKNPVKPSEVEASTEAAASETGTPAEPYPQPEEPGGEDAEKLQ